jgi:hypothetical protein
MVASDSLGGHLGEALEVARASLPPARSQPYLAAYVVQTHVYTSIHEYVLGDDCGVRVEGV